MVERQRSQKLNTIGIKRRMLKISRMDSGNDVVLLKLEGRIAGPWVAEMRKACEKFLKEGCTLKLHLAEISFTDRNGVAALATLKSLGVSISDCSPFLAEQLKTAQ